MTIRNVMHAAALLGAAIALLVSNMPALAAQTDSGIEASVRNSYVFKTYLKDDDITVLARDGAVTLTGTVNLDYHKALAKHTVESLPGVKSVDNRLELKSKSPLENTDESVRSQVTAALLFHRNAGGATTEVYVQEGIVTLRGGATSLAQKDLATEYAKDITGVKQVKNEMEVTKPPKVPDARTVGEKIGDLGEKIDDASITAMVKMALLYHRSTSALNTRVETNDGAVTLRGKAQNGYEKELAGKIAEDVHGVKSIKNQMAVK